MVATVMAHFTRRRTLAPGVGFTGVGVSSFVFAPLFQYMLDNFGWRGSLLILGGLSLNIVPCGALIRPTRKKAPPRPKAGGKVGYWGHLGRAWVWAFGLVLIRVQASSSPVASVARLGQNSRSNLATLAAARCCQRCQIWAGILARSGNTANSFARPIKPEEGFL